MNNPFVAPQGGRAVVGFGRRDMTPPVGIYARMWGAASHDRSEGTHRPLTATAMAVRSSEDGAPAVLVAVDQASMGDLAGAEDEMIRAHVCEALGLDAGSLLVACSHTHAGPWAARSRRDLPGGEYIDRYLEQMEEAIREAAREAIATAQPATVTFAKGRCSLASTRDQVDPDNPRRYLTGYNPNVQADDTVVVGRVTRDSDGAIIGTFVNYACHPTTLAWENRLISPDYPGAMREVVEGHTGGAPCLFLQGASGELAPALQYVGDVRIADRYGRQLGFAALSALESMLPPGDVLRYQGAVESGAPLGVWRAEPGAMSDVVRTAARTIQLPTKSYSIPEIEAEMANSESRFQEERLRRKLAIATMVRDRREIASVAYVWRIGTGLLVGQQNEAYSAWQKAVRAAFPEFAVVTMNCVNYAATGYVTPDELQDLDLYQAWQPPFTKGALDTLIRECVDLARTLI